MPVPVVLWNLGPGEAAVIACALANPDAEVVLDDLAGRRCAETMLVPVRGTVGLVLAAKQRGVIPLARPVLEDLRSSGMYLSDRVLTRALGMVGE